MSNPATKAPNFVKGNKFGRGRAKGTSNKTTMLLRSALTGAATEHGYDGLGKGGLKGFCRYMLETHLEHFWMALIKTMPQAKGDPTDDSVAVMEYRTVLEMRQAMMDHGLPMRTILDLVDPNMRSIELSSQRGANDVNQGNGKAAD